METKKYLREQEMVDWIINQIHLKFGEVPKIVRIGNSINIDVSDELFSNSCYQRFCFNTKMINYSEGILNIYFTRLWRER